MSTAASTPPDDLAELVGGGDRRALAQAISIVEDSEGSTDDLLSAVRRLPGQRARRVAVTGPPGAGKSTLLGRLVVELLAAGRRVGVLLVDPSSPTSGGAVLGDRIRLQRHGGDELYIRSVAARGHAGGVASATPKLADLLEGWGADVVVIETVGAGQAEIDVCRIADCTVAVCPPGLGDELQSMKAGLMEVADVFVVNKADRPGAETTERSLKRVGPGGRGQRVRPVLRTVAASGDGVPELVEAVDTVIEQDGLREPDPDPSLNQASTTTASAVTSAPSYPPMFDLTGRVALVTGATGGLGRRFAEVLHDAGASVVLAGRRAERLDELHRTLTRSAPVPCDVSDADQRADLLEAALAAFGRLDILVNNAGISGDPVPTEDFPSDRWQQTVDVNLSGLFDLTRLVGRHMLEQERGSIINIASVFGLVANSPVSDAAYAATKGAVVNLTRALGVEWATRGVRVNAIAPGWFPSEMTAGMVEDEGSQRYVQRYCPMKRMGHEDELDAAVLFLAGDGSSYCTGQTMAIDGGWTAR